MHNGRISEIGSYQDLLSHDKAFAQFLKTYLTQDENDDSKTDPEGKFCVLYKTSENCFIHVIVSLKFAWNVA